MTAFTIIKFLEPHDASCPSPGGFVPYIKHFSALHALRPRVRRRTVDLSSFIMFFCTRLLSTTTKTPQPDLLAFLVLLQLTTVQVLASVYPTQPVADTVYTLGQLAEITWKDDGRAPQLKDMGLMEINLCASTVGSASNMEVSDLHSALQCTGCFSGLLLPNQLVIC